MIDRRLDSAGAKQWAERIRKGSGWIRSSRTFKRSRNDGKCDFQFAIYPGAVPAFTNPEADAMAAATGLKGIGCNAVAAHRSGTLLQQFFDEIFAAK
jgi:hypothetical protein